MAIQLRCCIVALLTVAGTAAPAAARPAHKQAFAEYFGPYLPKKLHDCRTCHLPTAPGAKEDLDAGKPHNAFGLRLVAVKTDLKKAGKKTTIADRLDAILDEDTDDDGVSNVLEILAGRYPGETADRPTAAEVAEAKKILPLWKRYRASYPWRPFDIVQRPAVPNVKNAAWARTPLDAFLALEHEKLGLQPRPEAPRHALLRRVYLDLIGLPPTTAELRAFLADEAPDAYEKVVDKLLADPRHGERWGRHWMDVWRYSDWAGYGPEVRDSQPHIWRWRDWIVSSLNADKGYDRMIVEMLAGDELAPDDPQVLAATGYLVRNWKKFSREKWLQDTVEHTFQAFLGMTLGCARCHDHMFDPLTQKEYYQVRAIFDPHNVRTDRLPGQADVAKDGLVRVFDDKLDIKTFLLLRGDDRTPDKTALPPGVPEALGGKAFAARAVKLPRDSWCPDKRAFVVDESLAASAAAAAQAEKAWQIVQRDAAAATGLLLSPTQLSTITACGFASKTAERATLARLDLTATQAKHQALLALLRLEALEDAGHKGSAEWKTLAAATRTLQRTAALAEAQRNQLAAKQTLAALTLAPGGKGDAKKRTAAETALTTANKMLAQVEAAQKKNEPATAFTPRPIQSYPKESTGRRLSFARWVADKDNPLTARVAMNHLWLRHFGQALAPTVFDFGRNGRQPSHPALLDWLAAEFMERGWSMKAIHKLIVTSSAYRMASTPDTRNAAIDNDNKYLWRFAPRQLEAEAVRDCIFYVADKLDPAMGGPEIAEQQGLTVARRSIYFRHAAEKQMEFLAIFDGPSVTECYERKQAIVPQQALALANSDLVRKHSRLLAKSLAAKAGKEPAAFVTAAFEAVLTRSPTAEELAECTEFLNKMQPEAALRARESLVHVLLNHHEFVTIR